MLVLVIVLLSLSLLLASSLVIVLYHCLLNQVGPRVDNKVVASCFVFFLRTASFCSHAGLHRALGRWRSYRFGQRLPQGKGVKRGVPPYRRVLCHGPRVDDKVRLAHKRVLVGQVDPVFRRVLFLLFYFYHSI